MALVSYTEADLQEAIHAIYEGDNDTPDSADDEYLYRRILMNVAVNRWENDKGVLWNELWTDTATDSTGADLSISSGDTVYETPTNFRFPGGFVKIMDGTSSIQTIALLKPEQAQNIEAGVNFVYVKGNYKDGHKIVLPSGVASTYDGKTLKYDFYKRATKFDSTDDVPEMADPMYIVHNVCAELFKSDNNVTLYTAHQNEAEERLKQMEILNMQNTHYQGLESEDTLGGIIGL